MGDATTPHGRQARRRARRATSVVGAACAFVAIAGAAPAIAAPPQEGTAKVMSVDGPARVTVKTTTKKTKPRTIKLRLLGIDTPQVGECGATESVAELERLVARGKKKGFRYELAEREDGSHSKDPDGRWRGWLSAPRVHWSEGSLTDGLIAANWAREGEAAAPDAALVQTSDFASSGPRDDSVAPGAPRGVWAKCGGRVYLPANAPVVASEPAPWTISADGVTESIGPIALSPTMTPATSLTPNKVAAVAPVEIVTLDAQSCVVYVPTLQLRLRTGIAPRRGGCGAADVYEIESMGRATTTRGVGIGSTRDAMEAAFPRAATDEDGEGILFLTGLTPVLWAWQTIGWLSDASNQVDSLMTRTGPLPLD